MPGEAKVITMIPLLIIVVVVKKIITPGILVLPYIRIEDPLENFQDHKI